MLDSVRVTFRCIFLKNKPFTLCKDKFLNIPQSPGPSTHVPSRTTIIVKRPFPPGLYKEGNKPRMRKRTFYYDFVEDTDIRPDPLIDVVLATYVQGVGNAGDLVSMKLSAAYNKLLVPGLADYASPEMIEYSNKVKADEKLQDKQISVSVERTLKYLQETCLSVVMNQFNEWTIEPWHIRASARKAGIHILSDDCIELPSKPVKGPDMALEGKNFFVNITINKKFKVKVRCVIHHWTANASARLPFVPEWWLAPPEMIFPEDEHVNQDNSPLNPS